MNYINIAIIGPVSTGKSTFLNTLFIDNFSEMNIRRTTMQPQIYTETFQTFNVKQISETNNNSNTKYYNDKNIEIKPVCHNVGFIKDFVKLDPHVLLKIHDLPGINDSNTEEVYMNYIMNKFNVYDIVFFLIDINSSLNTSSEVKILDTIIAQIAKQKKEYNKEMLLYIIANKYDGPNKEYDEMMKQIRKIVNEHLKKYNLEDLKHKIIRLSMETAYIYRMKHFNPNEILDIKYVDKLGLDNYSRKTWIKYNEEQKRQHIANLVNENDYREMMKECKFEILQNNLQNDLSVDMQYRLMCNQYKIGITNAIKNHGCGLGMGSKFYTCVYIIVDMFNKIIDLNKLFYVLDKDEISNISMFVEPISIFFYDCLTKSENQWFWISEYTIDIYMLIKKLALMTGLKSAMLMLNEIKNNVEKIYVIKLEDKDLDIEEGLKYISKLENYLDNGIEKYYEDLLINNKNVYKMNAQDIINLDNEILNKCSNIDIKQIVSHQLKYIYGCIYMKKIRSDILIKLMFLVTYLL